MRIAELARRGGVGVSTVKYYLSIRLLPPGAVTARNQATYGEEHVYRLFLVRTLLETGGLSVARARAVLEAVDAEVSVAELLGVLGEAGVPGRGARERLADAIARAGRLDVAELAPAVPAYAEAAARVAGCDAMVIAAVRARLAAAPGVTRADLLERIVAAVVLGKAATAALSALARDRVLAGEPGSPGR
jgi:DNA-binding transcriptional MerR regulator